MAEFVTSSDGYILSELERWLYKQLQGGGTKQDPGLYLVISNGVAPEVYPKLVGRVHAFQETLAEIGHLRHQGGGGETDEVVKFTPFGRIN